MDTRLQNDLRAFVQGYSDRVTNKIDSCYVDKQTKELLQEMCNDTAHLFADFADRISKSISG